MRIVIAVMLLLVVSVAYGEGQEAYVMIDAVAIPEDSRQPTWIAVGKLPEGKLTRYRRTKMTGLHVPTHKTIVQIEPGHYVIGHVDFGKSKRSNRGTVTLEHSSQEFLAGTEFEVVPNTITFVGMLTVRTRGWTADLTLGSSDKMFVSACQLHPELFARLLVRVPQEDGTYKQVKIQCETEEDGT